MDKKLVGIIILILVAGALVSLFAKYQYGKDYTDNGLDDDLGDDLGVEDEIIIEEEDTGCNIDSDCGWHYTDYNENNPCGGCSVIAAEYVCMNNNAAEDLFLDKMNELFGGLENVPRCEPCTNPDFESYFCKCVSNSCVKERV